MITKLFYFDLFGKNSAKKFQDQKILSTNYFIKWWKRKRWTRSGSDNGGSGSDSKIAVSTSLMKTLFKATMKPKRQLECHVEQTTLKKRNKIKANSSDCAGTPSSKAWTTC